MLQITDVSGRNRNQELGTTLNVNIQEQFGSCHVQLSAENDLAHFSDTSSDLPRLPLDLLPVHNETSL